MFQPRTSFGGFPSGGAGLRRFHDGGECGEESLGSLPARSADRWGGGSQLRPPPTTRTQHHQADDEGFSDHSSNSSGDSHRPDSVPIKVIHSGRQQQQQQRPRYTGRNTTELPGGGGRGPSGNESPRLERAHSEPPNKFTQRLNLGRPAGGGYTTIPENGVESGGANSSGGGLKTSAVRGGPDASSASSSGKILIKPSASAPSVPASGDSFAQPVPPPRRSPPRHNQQQQSSNNSNTMNNNSNPPPHHHQTAVPLASGSNVRHIPIFVEGRPEPIFNTGSGTGSGVATAAAAPQPPPSEMSFPKPSDYYPPGVQRIRSRDSECGTPDFQFQPFGGEDPFRTHTPTGFRSTASGQQPPPPAVEPTTPMGPPPGVPIPMGYVPTPGVPKEIIQEPTTPLGPPPGPIPMGYTPSAPSAEVTAAPIPLPCDPSLVQQQQLPPPVAAAAQGDVKHISSPPPPPPPPPSSAARARTASQSGAAAAAPAATVGEDATDQGLPPPPVVNFIPIRVDHSGSLPRRSSAKNPPQPQQQQQREGSVSGAARTMPRSLAPPRKGGAQEEGGDQALLAKLDSIRQEVENLGQRINNFKVRQVPWFKIKRDTTGAHGTYSFSVCIVLPIFARPFFKLTDN